MRAGRDGGRNKRDHTYQVLDRKEARGNGVREENRGTLREGTGEVEN